MAFEALAAEMTLDSGGFTRGMTAAKASMSDAESQASSMKKTMGKMGAGIAAVSAGALAGATAAAAKFETQMVELEKVSSKEFASGFRDTIMQMSRELPSTANELAGLAAAAKRFGVAEKHVESFVRATSKMAIATDISIDQAGESFAKLATLTQTPIPKIENLGSSINALSNTMATSSSEIVDSMLRAAGTLSQMGASQTEIAGLSAAMNAVSESAERAGTRLRRVAQEMMDPAKVGALGQALGVTATEFKQMVKNDPTGTMLALAKTMKEGGANAEILNRNLSTTSRQALAGLGSNLGQVNKALDTSAKAFKENTSLQKEFKAAMGTTEMAVKQLKSSLLAVAIDTGTVFLPYVTAAINALRGMVDAFGVLNSKTGGVAGALTLVGGVIAGLTTAVVAFLPQIASIATILSGSVIPALGSVAAVLTGPVGLAIAGAIAAIAGLAYAWNNNLGGIQTKVKAFGAEVKRIFGEVTAWLGEFKQVINDVLGGNFATALTRAETLFRSAFERMSAYITGTAIPAIVGAITGLLDKAGEVFGMLQAKLPPLIAKAFEAVRVWVLQSGIPLMVAAMENLASMAAKGLNVFVTRVYPLISKAITTALDWILTTGIPLAMDAVGAWATAAADTLSTLIDILPPIIADAWDALYAWVTGPGIQLAGQAFTTVVNHIGTVVGLLQEKLPPLLQTAITGLVNWISSNGLPLVEKSFSALVTGALAAWEVFQRDIVPLVQAGVGALVDWVTTNAPPLARAAFDLLVQAGLDTIQTLKTQLPPLVKQGVTALVTWLENNGPGLVKSGFEALGTAIRLVWEGLFKAGGLLMTLLGEGIGLLVSYLQDDAADDLKAAGEIAFDALVTIGEETLKALTPPDGIITQIIGDIVGYLKGDAWSDLKAAAEFLFDVIMAAAEGLAEGLIHGSLIPEMFVAIKDYIVNTATGLIKTAIQGYVDAVTTIFELWWDNTLGRFGTFFGDVVTELSEFATTFSDDATTFLSNLFDSFESWFGDIRDEVGNKAEGVKDDVLGFMGDMKSSIVGKRGIIPNLKSEAVDLIGAIGSEGATAFKNAWNSAIPSSLSIPSVSVDIPDFMGGGSKSIGGGSISLPQLHTGGFIEETGVFVGREGERVLNPAETKRYADGERPAGGGDITVEAPITIEGNADEDAVKQMQREFDRLVSEIERLQGRSTK